MRIVVDTNIVVSAILRGQRPKKVIQSIIDRPDWAWLVSPEIIAEYKEVLLRPKFKLSQEVIEEWWEIFETVTLSIEVEVEVDFPRDRKDAKFLACALGGNANFFNNWRSRF
ncbi:putative toxin-antitoxin system toxin component, PIN family [Tychonema sp. BBK16]|uniref:putative toxin-antitoxin system toxin component, PIN family n=1 Tax=Tychonema sp. BBK16 TaxID=2699888 RepID=UPI001F1BA59B|nr:putative toxin-antitoxin system toxin component, PIN family [Tychonema sp. BBK16]MCF6371584.1 putative toxin-antitoxin system toxin component, PIN family [Tychonema sp. BBK16]